MERTRRLLKGPVGRIVLPAVILQSVLIGGGYATGREIVAYGAKYGALGWLSVLAIFAGFTVISVLTFEVARVFRAYEYKGFIRSVIGPAWPLFDVLYGAMAVLVIAIMASAAAEIMDTTLGVPPLLGTGLVVAAVGVLTYFGASAIEAFKSVGTGLLYLAYLAFGVAVLWGRWDGVTEVFATGSTAYSEGAGPLDALGSGILYVGYNLAVYPAVLFVLHRQGDRRDSLISGLLAGLMMTLPFALTYLCILAFYPMPRVLDAPVPWLPMLSAAGGGALVAVYGAVMGWTLLETSVGLIHALLDRADAALERAAGGETGEDVPVWLPGDGGGSGNDDGLSPLQRGLIGAGVLAAAALLSRVGIIALVAQGYTFMAYGFIALFALPLLTVGVYRVFVSE
mgnify:CR=1 FL=1